MRSAGRVRAVVALSGGVFGGIGLFFLLYPSWVTLVDLELPTPAAASDVRALFGGLELGVGVFLVWAAFWPGWLRAGLLAQLLAFGGLVLGRVLSFALDGWPGLVSLGLLAGELVGLGLGLLAAGHWARRASALPTEPAGDPLEAGAAAPPEGLDP
ncbi:MAG: DUF4345 domain-containing protein [Myxococcota bacterium]